MLNEIKGIRAKVKRLLEGHPDTRNNDKQLIIRWWNYDHSIDITDDFVTVVEKMPAFESITRARREVQKDHEHLRSDKQIKRERDRNEKETHRYYGYVKYQYKSIKWD